MRLGSARASSSVRQSRTPQRRDRTIVTCVSRGGEARGGYADIELTERVRVSGLDHVPASVDVVHAVQDHRGFGDLWSEPPPIEPVLAPTSQPSKRPGEKGLFTVTFDEGLGHAEMVSTGAESNPFVQLPPSKPSVEKRAQLTLANRAERKCRSTAG